MRITDHRRPGAGYEHAPPSWPPDRVNAPWLVKLGAELLAEELSQRHWINQLARAWCLVRRADALEPGELLEQEDYTERALGRRFYTTEPAGWRLELWPDPAGEHWVGHIITDGVNPLG